MHAGAEDCCSLLAVDVHELELEIADALLVGRLKHERHRVPLVLSLQFQLPGLIAGGSLLYSIVSGMHSPYYLKWPLCRPLTHSAVLPYRRRLLSLQLSHCHYALESLRWKAPLRQVSNPDVA